MLNTIGPTQRVLYFPIQTSFTSAGRLVGALYAPMDRFDLFAELTLLYFAAASYSEAVRRLGKPQLADGFLLCRHPVFARRVRQICEAVSESLSADAIGKLSRSILETIQPFDVAGFTDQSRHPWYPAMTSDLLRSVGKVNAIQNEIQLMLTRCGLRSD